jgi:two-component system LytT family response regulator
MINTVIIDDEKRGISSLKSLLKDYCPDVNLLGEANSVESGLNLIHKSKPSLVFLDIEMPDGTGFDLLEQLPEKNFHVIFTTAHDHYALRAIKFSALDYLLKPIGITELKAAIEKVKSKSSDDAMHDNIALLIKNLSADVGKTPEKIALPTGDGHIFISIQDIIRFEAEGNYTYVFLTNGEKITVSRTLKQFENFIDENNFARIHHSHFINIHHVKHYVKGSGGFVVMIDGSKVEVSIRKKEEFLRKMRIH